MNPSDPDPINQVPPAAAPEAWSRDAWTREPAPEVPAYDAYDPYEPFETPVPNGAGRRNTGGQNRLATLATILLVVALAFGSGIAVGRATAPAGTGGIAAASSIPAGSTAAPGSSPNSAWLASLPSSGSLLGRKDAKLTITYWADFQCPYCQKFALDVLPQLASRIADGTVAVQHRDYAFIGPESIDAAIAVRCAGEQSKYWQMHDAVYAAQAGENQGAFAASQLAQIAASVGLDANVYTACIARHDVFVAVLADTSAAVQAAITSTPTIDVAGQRFLGVTDAAAFLAAVDKAAAAAASGATPAPEPTATPSGDPWAGTATTGREAGPATAPVTVQLWMDYQSTDSVAVPNTLEPELRTRITAGKIHVVLHDLALLGPESVAASVMVRCTAAQNGPAWFVHDILAVSAQGANAGIFVTKNLLSLGSRLGLDVTAMDTCMADPSIAALVNTDTAAGQKLGLTAGPALVILVGTREVARFSGAFDLTKVLAAIDSAK